MQHSCFLRGSHIHIADLTSTSDPRLLFHSLLYGSLFCKEKKKKKKAKHKKAKQNKQTNKKKPENKNKKKSTIK
uniref:Uncharacterized protein n=1 Tax=Sciurus vulgaris TaxID=55149 RepID=A0A8D2CT98_SCIVU